MLMGKVGSPSPLLPSRPFTLERAQSQEEASVAEDPEQRKGPWATLEPAFLWSSQLWEILCLRQFESVFSVHPKASPT